MTKIKSFIQFHMNENTGADTDWRDSYAGKPVVVTLKDLNRYLDSKKVPVEEIDTKLIKYLLIDAERDQSRVDSANLDFPIIISRERLHGKFIHILDGHHRLAKSVKNNIAKIKVRFLDLDTASNLFKWVFRK